MRKYVGLILGIPLMWVVEHRYGPIGGTRLFGMFFVAAGACFCFVHEVPVHLGTLEVGRLRGWKKTFAVVPAIALGIATMVYAPGLTCISSKYRHLCEQPL